MLLSLKKKVYVSHNFKPRVLDLLIGHILNSNKNAYFIFGIFLYEIGSVITRKQFESHRRCMMLCCFFQTKPLNNAYSLMHDSRMHAYGVKCKSHTWLI